MARSWDAPTCFLDEGAGEIDNDIAERALRGFAIAWKNRLFAGS